MANFGTGSLQGSVRFEQHLQQRNLKTTPGKFGQYMFPSIITTNEPVDRNPESFANRHLPDAIDYSDPFAGPPSWRKQVMMPYPAPPAYIERKSYGISRIDYQNLRRTMREQAEEAAAEERSMILRQQQEEQRVETEKVAEAQRVTKIIYAVNKINLGSPLTIEDEFVLLEDARMRDQKKLEKWLAGDAGAEAEAKAQEAAAAAAAAKEAEEEAAAAEASYYRALYNTAVSRNTPASRNSRRTVTPPVRIEIVEYDPAEPPIHLQARLPPHRRRLTVLRPKPKSLQKIIQETLQLLVFALPLFFYILFHHLSCPDGFRYCPCGIVKRPWRFLAKNPHLPFAIVVLVCAMWWETVVYCLVWGMWGVLCVGGWIGLCVFVLSVEEGS
ncbi:MAG: hypothetical protein LQ338_003455 [Usnochroma carphineum]|nr:MAG: hypothetical protein LQ338_003455 [Usnochroma carphineum]